MAQKACVCCACRTPWDIRWNKQRLTAGEKRTLSPRQMRSSKTIKLQVFMDILKRTAALYSDNSASVLTAVAGLLRSTHLCYIHWKRKLPLLCTKGLRNWKYTDRLTVLLPLAPLVRSDISHLSSLTGLYYRTKCLSCVTDRLKQFVVYLFDPKFYRPCNKNNLHFISHLCSEVWISLGCENRNLLSQPLSLPWSSSPSSSSSSSVDQQP